MYNTLVYRKCISIKPINFSGMFFSINANMIQNRNASKKILKIPKDKILVESDGPFTKINGKRFLPEYLQEEYLKIGKYLNLDDFSFCIYNNFINLFEI